MNDIPGTEPGKVSLRLYVAGNSSASSLARRQLAGLLAGIEGHEVEVETIDVLEQPQLAEQARVLATPTLVRVAPEPQRSIIGDLGDTSMVVAVLGLTGTEGDELR